ncbi:hypothetical protein ACFL6T_05540 [Candidatus Zixiibacteriota bacterium]
MQPIVSRRGVQLTLIGQDLTRSELLNTCSHAEKMDVCARQVGAAFLVGGGILRQSSGEFLASVILYGTDDRAVIAAESRSFLNELEMQKGIVTMAEAISHPRVLTPSDTPIMYSLVIPGTGQLMLRRPIHAILFAGLFVRAILREPDIPLPEYDLFLPRWHKRMDERRIMNVVATWLANVADTMILTRVRQKQVDPSLFFSIVDSHGRNRGSGIVPMAGFRVKFRPR